MFGAIPDFNQSLEMFKTMWGQNAAATPGAGFMPDLSASMLGSQGAMPGDRKSTRLNSSHRT